MNNKEETLTLSQILEIIRKNIYLLISVIVSITIISFLFAFFIMKPEYSTKTSLLVNPTKFSSSSSSDVSGGIRATGTIANWITEDIIVENTITRLENSNVVEKDEFTAKKFKDSLKITNSSNDLYIYVTFKGRDKEKIQNCLNTLIEVGIEKSSNYEVIKDSYDQISLASDPIKTGKSKLLIIAIGFIAGCAVGVLVLFLKDLLKTKFTDENDVEKITGYKVIGKQIKFDEAKLDFKIKQRNQNNYEKLLTNIDFSNIGEKVKVIEFTSPEKSDGKSTTVLNVVKVLDSQNRKAIVIDLDLRMPSIHKSFNVSNINGITDYCANKVKKEDIIKSFSPNIDVITCGTIAPNPLLVLQSKCLIDLIDELKGEYEYIILDCPPHYVSCDSKVISNFADAIIFTISANKTKIKETKIMLDDFSSCSTKIIGINVNRLKINKYDSYYNEK